VGAHARRASTIYRLLAKMPAAMMAWEACAAGTWDGWAWDGPPGTTVSKNIAPDS